MKKLFLLAGFYCLHLSSHAQSASEKNIHFSNKKMEIANNPKTVDRQSINISVNARAMQDFKASYPNVQDETWGILPNGEMLCMFHFPGILTRLYYDKHGYKKCTISGYEGENLRKEVRDQVLSNYDGYHIRYVNEISMKGVTVYYIITIEDCNHIKVIRVAGDEMQVQQGFEK